MDNVGIVVDDLPATIEFFRELGLELEGQFTIEGEWSGRVTGLRDQRVEVAMMRTPDGHSRLELSRFVTPPVVADHRSAPPACCMRHSYSDLLCPVGDTGQGRRERSGRDRPRETVQALTTIAPKGRVDD